MSQDIKVYTDGSCINNQNPMIRRAGWATYYENVEFKHHSSYGLLPGKTHTNNRAELWAILIAITTAIDKKIPTSGQHLVIHTDSEYSIDIITGTKRAKSNKDILNQINEAIKQAKYWFIIDFEHVSAHVGIPGNELVDKYAKMGAIMMDEIQRFMFESIVGITPDNTPVVKPVIASKRDGTNLEAYFTKAMNLNGTSTKKKKQKTFKEFVPIGIKSVVEPEEEIKNQDDYRPTTPICMNCYHMADMVSDRMLGEFRDIMSQYNLPRKTVHSSEFLSEFNYPTISTNRDGSKFDELNGQTIVNGDVYYILWSSGVVDKVTMITRGVYEGDVDAHQSECGLVTSFIVGYNGVNIPVRIRDIAGQIKMKKL